MICSRYRHEMVCVDGRPCVIGGNKGPISIELHSNDSNGSNDNNDSSGWRLIAFLDASIFSFSVFTLNQNLLLLTNSNAVSSNTRWKVKQEFIGNSNNNCNDCSKDDIDDNDDKDSIGLQAVLISLPPTYLPQKIVKDYKRHTVLPLNTSESILLKNTDLMLFDNSCL